jgi:hypothetical protein
MQQTTLIEESGSVRADLYQEIYNKRHQSKRVGLSGQICTKKYTTNDTNRTKTSAIQNNDFTENFPPNFVKTLGSSVKSSREITIFMLQ